VEAPPDKRVSELIAAVLRHKPTVEFTPDPAALAREIVVLFVVVFE
jgi:hypothetical protein